MEARNTLTMPCTTPNNHNSLPIVANSLTDALADYYHNEDDYYPIHTPITETLERAQPPPASAIFCSPSLQ
uniref:Uncharacterized protein n=1 Tax=Romanomermis culicivorax TaxID=13658 RepID=A0A915ILA3_ROMCU